MNRQSIGQLEILNSWHGVVPEPELTDKEAMRVAALARNAAHVLRCIREGLDPIVVDAAFTVASDSGIAFFTPDHQTTLARRTLVILCTLAEVVTGYTDAWNAKRPAWKTTTGIA